MFKINNIKLSVKIDLTSLNIVKERLIAENISYKEYPNFIVFKEVFTYTIFKHNQLLGMNHVNITQVPSVEKISYSLEIIKKVTNVKIISCKIDNIIATLKWSKTIDLLKFSHKFLHKPIKYNNQKFPGLFIKYPKGTVLVFYSGKIVVVGCSEITIIKNIFSEVIDFLENEFSREDMSTPQ